MKRILAVLIAAVVVTGLAAGLSVRATVKAVPRLFKRNAELKAQGYYMGEFEFKMVAVIYYLNEGSYVKEIWARMAPDTSADVDGTSTALGLLRATGSLPGTWERQRLWGKAIAAPPELVRAEFRTTSAQ